MAKRAATVHIMSQGGGQDLEQTGPSRSVESGVVVGLWEARLGKFP